MRALGVFLQPDTQALVMENRGRSKTREPRGRGGKSRSKFKSGVKCYHCGQLGHMKRNCYLLKGKDKKKVEDGNTTAVASTSGGDVTLLCDRGEYCHVENSDAEWIIDSGASYHCVPKREYFSTYKVGDFGTIKMGNKSVSHIMGVGDICVQTNVGCTLTLKNVRHVPDMRMNLLSAKALDEEGYAHYFGNGNWKLTKGSMVVAKGRACCSLYKTHMKMCGGQLNTVEDEASPNLWHNRLAHMSEKELQLLAKQSLILMAKGEYVNPCDVYLFGKQHRVSFQKNLTRKENKLDLVYFDVCGPLEVQSFGGNKYFVTFIDDATRKTWVYLLQNKSQVCKYFQHYHAMVERETGLKLKCLRTDNGGEYTSKEFRDYCSKHGMRHEKTVPGTPQHNGVAERMNRTIVEKVRCMLRMATLPKPFWGEAVNTAVYLINQSPSVPLNFEIPEKAWTGKDVGYSHLRVFGCKAFMHVPKEQRSKLDDKTIPCIFVGYGDEEFGYRLWDPEKKKTVRSRDVVFHEHEKINDLKEDKATGSSGEGVEDLTLAKTPSRKITNEEEVQAPEDETEEPTIEEDEASVDGGNDEQGEQPLPQEEEPQLRRSTREHKPSARYSNSDYILITEEGEPENFQEGQKTLKNKWVFKLKKDGDKIVRYKAWLVVKGFSQKKGIDFDEIFSPVVKMSSIRVVLGLAASMNLELEQLDVKTAFLHGDLHEEIYMDQPEGFEEKGKEHMVCKLKKSLYGLEQAPRQWYKKFDSFMMSHGYQRTNVDPCVYIRSFPDGNFIILLLYVDDMLILGQDVEKICSAEAPISWINNNSDPRWDSEELTLQPIFVNEPFVCGFHCKVAENNTCLFAISIFVPGGSSYPNNPISKMIWSANRNNPVGRGAKLQLSQQGDLTLQDVDSTLVWSTKIAGKSTSELMLTDSGNLMLFDRNKEMVWQSFDHPTDSLVPGQRLVSGKKLVANMSATNWSEGLYSFSIDNNGSFVAYMESDATLLYYQAPGSQLRSKTGQFYAEYDSTSFGTFHFPEVRIATLAFSVIQLDHDGHLSKFWGTETGGILQLPRSR
ncbi:hypothetical protein SLEP1_g39821 [Rubroshorea leprosula]|uniref:Uncharacterized protein n=1 Tax=Rubroshorea leprosula TaxID=152421 RepID=A0AAV5L1T7_9ROSI|nr:hypothetical protein SLEP1_g39821 [Rubroshorea leprosula]